VNCLAELLLHQSAFGKIESAFRTYSDSQAFQRSSHQADSLQIHDSARRTASPIESRCFFISFSACGCAHVRSLWSASHNARAQLQLIASIPRIQVPSIILLVGINRRRRRAIARAAGSTSTVPRAEQSLSRADGSGKRSVYGSHA
jgi:hypothetical protein